MVTDGRASGRIGVCSEMAVALDLTRRGGNVLWPADPTSPYDLVVDTGRRFLRVQVKTAHRRPAKRWVGGHRGRNDWYFRGGGMYVGTADVMALVRGEAIRYQSTHRLSPGQPRPAFKWLRGELDEPAR